MVVASKDRRSPLSMAAAQIVQRASSPDVALSDLSDVAASDPAFAMRILAMANSPAFGSAVRIDDVRRAASQLGIRGLRNLALSLVLSDMVPMGRNAEVLLANALRRAVSARVIATKLGFEEADRAFTAGLLLDAGLLVWAREALSDAVEVAAAPAEHRSIKERAFGQGAHTSTGAALAQTMGIGDEVVQAILHHHDPEPPSSGLACIAWTAEQVASTFEGGGVELHRARAAEALKALKLDPEPILDAIPELTTEAGRALDRGLGPQPDLNTLVRDANRSLVELNDQYQAMVRQLQEVLSQREALTRELRQANARLEDLARHDGLTGIPNRGEFDRWLAEALGGLVDESGRLALVLLDLDHFKKVNDEHGHPAGDDVLRAFAQILRASVRGRDLCARYGGEEFALVLAGADIETARTVATRVRVAVQSARIHTSAGHLRVTVSCGVAATSGPSPATTAELISAADDGLYQAKAGGRNRVCSAGCITQDTA